jgi:acetyl esterase/lipase
MITKMIIMSVLIAEAVINVSAQPVVVKLWPKGVPNSIKNKNYKETIVQSWGRNCYANVVDPEILVYPAPKEKSNGTAIVICPGGGYTRISYVNEGNDIVTWLNENGITAIILKYRLPSDSIMKDKSVGPLQDAQEAVRVVRRNAKEWGIDKSKIGIMGFSAGGHLASTLCTHFTEKIYEPVDTTSARPDFAVLVYPVISMISSNTHSGSRSNLLGSSPDSASIIFFSNDLHVTSATPPTFLVHSADDKTVPVANSINYFSALQKNKVQSEMHIYQTGGHGYGLAKNGKTESQWSEACIKWIKAIGH